MAPETSQNGGRKEWPSRRGGARPRRPHLEELDHGAGSAGEGAGRGGCAPSPALSGGVPGGSRTPRPLGPHPGGGRSRYPRVTLFIMPKGWKMWRCPPQASVARVKEARAGRHKHTATYRNTTALSPPSPPVPGRGGTNTHSRVPLHTATGWVLAADAVTVGGPPGGAAARDSGRAARAGAQRLSRPRAGRRRAPHPAARPPPFSPFSCISSAALPQPWSEPPGPEADGAGRWRWR